MTDYDAIIVGAGHNGLAAGVVLAKAGMRVLCLERTGHVGGMAATRELFKGFKHNVGAWAVIVLHEDMRKLLELDQYGLELITPPTSFCVFGAPGEFCHGLLHPGQMFHRRPVPGRSNYQTPLQNLHMCGAGCPPGPGVTCVPGYNAAQEVLKRAGG